MSLIDETPYKGKLGGYYDFERPYLDFYSPKSSLTGNSKTSQTPTADQKANKPFYRVNMSGGPMSQGRDDHGPDRIQRDVKPLSDMTVDELAAERDRVAWANDNLGGALSRSKQGKEVGTQHYAQSALNMAFPVAGVASGVINMITGSRLDSINQEINSRFDKGLLSNRDKDLLGFSGNKQPGIQLPSDDEFLNQFLGNKKSKPKVRKSTSSSSSYGGNNDAERGGYDRGDSNFGFDRDGRSHGSSF